ncbi:hypothetical protein [Bradyrhizobium sp.]|uniref:hypothetical protein n=1 Tax=Bradyrhizobium sp. TaxID=376 RepID=UPI004037AEC6
MALLGNLLGTVDGLLGTATGVLDETSTGVGATTSTEASADLSHTLDLGAAVATEPSVELSALGIDASVSAPTMVGLSADVGQLDANGLLHGLV